MPLDRERKLRYIVKIAPVAVLAAALALTGCGKGSSTAAAPPSTFRGVPASGQAAVPGADKAAAELIIRQCAPATATATAQLRWATGLVNDTSMHPNGSRQRLLSCVGIPGPKRQAAEDAVIRDALAVKWTKASSRKVFWGQTLPGWVMTWRAA